MTISTYQGMCTCAAGCARTPLADPADAAGMSISGAAVTTLLADGRHTAAREPHTAA
jgi:hypothetical protein